MTTSQQFLDRLVEAAAPTCQPLIQGISDFHRDRGWISQRQAIAVKASARKEGVDVPPSLVIRDAQPAVQPPQPRQSVYDEYEDGPFPEHDVTIVRSGVKMWVDVGDKPTISNGFAPESTSGRDGPDKKMGGRTSQTPASAIHLMKGIIIRLSSQYLALLQVRLGLSDLSLNPSLTVPEGCLVIDIP